MTKVCPLLDRPCMQHGCEWWDQVQWTHPQTGEIQAKWACSVKWLPGLLIKNAQEVHQAAAATESARNEARTDAAAVAASVVRMAEEVGGAARAMVQRDAVRVLEAEKPRGLLRFFRRD